MKALRGFCLFLISLVLPHMAGAQVPQLIGYQGRIAVEGTNFTGTGQFKFALVNGSATASFWSNDGTGVGGSEPAAAVSLGVSNGLYSVLLGDATLANMTAIPHSVFTNSDVRLRVWFDNGVAGSQQLVPDQRLAAVGYAMMGASVPDAAITSAKLADGAVASNKLADGAVFASKLADGAITSNKLADWSVTSAKIASNAVTSTQLADTIALGGGSINGRLDIYRTSAGSAAISLDGANNTLTTYGDDDLMNVLLSGANYGRLQLYNSSPGNGIAVDLAANSSYGGVLGLYSSNANYRVLLNGANGGGYLSLYNSTNQVGAILDGDDLNGGGYLALRAKSGLDTISLQAQETAGSGALLLLGMTNEIQTVRLDGDVTSGGEGGGLWLYSKNGQETVEILGSEDSGSGGQIVLSRTNGTMTVQIDGDTGTHGGFVELYNNSGKRTVQVNGDSTQSGGSISVYATNASRTVYIEGSEASGYGGQILLYRTNGTMTVQLDGETGTRGGYMALYNDTGDLTLQMDGDLTGSAAAIGLYAASGTQLVSLVAQESSSTAGQLVFYRTNGAMTVEIDGEVASGGAGAGIWLYSTKGQQTVEILSQESTGVGGQIELYRTNGTRTVQIDGESGTGGGGYVAVYSSNGTALIELDSNVSGEGRITTPVLAITGGSDVSEQFDIKAATGLPEPGMIVCIDPDNPGALRVSAGEYDPTVAGIMSGAGGVKPGMLMGQSGTAADGQHPVALSGRVYCLVDADAGSIRPGDLITTSALPGHGMKAQDPARSSGSVLGKAMTGLEKGQGLILVLVTLQ